VGCAWCLKKERVSIAKATRDHREYRKGGGRGKKQPGGQGFHFTRAKNAQGGFTPRKKASRVPKRPTGVGKPAGRLWGEKKKKKEGASRWHKVK